MVDDGIVRCGSRWGRRRRFAFSHGCQGVSEALLVGTSGWQPPGPWLVVVVVLAERGALERERRERGRKHRGQAGQDWEDWLCEMDMVGR